MDHVVPVSRGGKSTKGNIVPCCKECNNAKKYLTPVEMLLTEMEKQEKASSAEEKVVSSVEDTALEQ